jgi:hypothetical protein
MGNQTSPLERLSEALREPAARYAQRLKELGGANVLGLVFHGAAVDGSFDRTRHTAQNVVVVETLRLDDLRQLGVEGPSFGRFHIAAPIVLTPRLIAGSLDTFPLEFIEILQRHVTISGPEYFSEEILPIQDAHVRLQCERELKIIQISLQQGLLKIGAHDRRLSALSLNLGENLLRVLRGLVWIHGQRRALPKFELVAAAAQVVGRELEGVNGALNDADTAGWAKVQALYDDVQALGQFVDAS